MTSVTSSISLCPINFKEFGKLNNKLENIEAALLFSKLNYHLKNSKIRKNGQTYIARSREQIAEWFDFSIKKIDRLLLFLESKELINKKAGLWYGKKKLFISTSEDFAQIPVNLKLLGILIEQIGSLKGALLFSKIAYAFANSKIQHSGLTWCCIKKEDLSSWSGFSIRTIDGLLENMIRTGLILKKNFIYKDKIQTHFHIPTFVIKVLHRRAKEEYQPRTKTEQSYIYLQDVKQEDNFSTLQGEGILMPNTFISESTMSTPSCSTLDEPYQRLLPSLMKSYPNQLSSLGIQNSHICREQPANLSVSIKISSNQKETINNTSDKELFAKRGNKNSAINFNSIGNELTLRQVKYLKGALKNTINRNKLKISSSFELWEQLQFTILNEQQHKGIQSFKHSVSRCMKILSDGNWKTPIGFYNHSAKGAEIKELNQEKIDNWEKQKVFDRQIAKEFCSTIGIVGELYNIKSNNTLHLTEKAMVLTKQLIYLAKHGLESQSIGMNELVKNLSTQIEGCIRLGADKEKISSYLKGGCVH